MISKIDDNMNLLRFGQIYGEGLDYHYTFFDYCGEAMAESKFNSLLKSNEVHEQNLNDFTSLVQLFAKYAFGECQIHSLTFNILFISGGQCKVS